MRSRDTAETLEAMAPERQHTLTQREVQREVRAVVKPVVREALTEDVLTSLADLIRLTPDAVQVLADQMANNDAVLAQKAATTVLRYTVGHQALVTAEATTAPQIVVNFDIPRPTDADFISDAIEDDATETFECDVCHEIHPTTDRAANANRCSDCHEKRKTAVLEQYGLIDSAHA